MIDKFSDEELVTKAKANDEKALEEIFFRYKNLVKNRSRQYFLIGADFEDLLQEGMVGLYNAIIEYDDKKGSFKNFAYTCISRRIISAIKLANRKKHQPLNNFKSLDEDKTNVSSPEDLIIDLENKTEFTEKLKELLSKLEYDIVILYIEGMSYFEIASLLNKSEKTVDNALSRAKKKIINKYEQSIG